MNLTVALVLGHLLGDFPLQTNWLYRLKTQSWIGVLLHTIVHLLVTALLITPVQEALPLLGVLGVLHFITDCAKVRIPAKRQAPGFLLDQIVHLAVIIVLGQQWQAEIASTLSSAVLFPMLSYAVLLGLMVFGWVVACDLKQSRWGDQTQIQWARANLLQFSQYAGIPLLLSLASHWYRQRYI